ncbi:MAG: hypothetical protein Kow0049_24020 [Stanieria sp.]
MDAAPKEVAITDTREAPTAYLISTPKIAVNRGTITTPPPKPVSAPTKPAVKEQTQTSNENSKIFTLSICCLAIKILFYNFSQAKYNTDKALE